MEKYYAILFGENGTKDFDTKEEAIEWGKRKANETREAVTLDVIDSYGSQHTIKIIKPQKKKEHHTSKSHDPLGMQDYVKKASGGLW